MYDDPMKPEYNWKRIGVTAYLLLGVILGSGRFMGWWRLPFIIGVYVWIILMALAVATTGRRKIGAGESRMRSIAITILIILGLGWISYWSSGLNGWDMGIPPWITP